MSDKLSEGEDYSSIKAYVVVFQRNGKLYCSLQARNNGGNETKWISKTFPTIWTQSGI